MLSNGVYLLLNKGDLTWFLRVLMLMMSGAYEQDSNAIRKINRKVVMFESSKFDKSPQIRRSYPAGAGFEKTAGFRPGPGPDMISSATLVCTVCFGCIVCDIV